MDTKIKREVPPIIREKGLNFHWDNHKVWSLDIPIEDMNVSELDWILHTPFWQTENGFYDLLPIEVINHPEKYPYHQQRILVADIKYPIDIMKNNFGQWLILDGLHRLARLIIEGHQIVKVRKISRGYITNILK